MWALPWAMSSSKKRKKIPQDVAEMRRRARILLQMFDEQKIELCVPSVVVSELLAGVDPSKHANVLANFEQRFFCPPFDLKACALAAKLWQFERGLKGTSSGLPQAERTERRLLKSDILIVASAKVAGASLFYSHEKKCRRLAEQAGMKAEDLPESSGNILTDLAIQEDEAEEA
jgi:hypothetical protein